MAAYDISHNIDRSLICMHSSIILAHTLSCASTSCDEVVISIVYCRIGTLMHARATQVILVYYMFTIATSRIDMYTGLSCHETKRIILTL